MKKLKAYMQTEDYQMKVKPELKRLFAVVFFTIIYGFGVKWFLESSVIPMYTGGIPGLGQLVRDFMKYALHIDTTPWEGAFLGIWVFVVNIPILILGWVGVSKKFVIYSLISVLIQSTMLGYIPTINIGLNSESQALTATILGGILVGIGTGGALKYGTSTGGLDIVAQYISLKKGQSVGFISMIMNISTAVLGGIISAQYLVDNQVLVGVDQVTAAAGIVISYTILRIIVSTIMTDRLHTAYQFLSVEIITEMPDQIIGDILVKIHRGVTLLNVKGGYTHKEKTLLKVIISSYELTILTQLVHQVDQKAFIVTQPVRQVIGNFKKKTIA